MTDSNNSKVEEARVPVAVSDRGVQLKTMEDMWRFGEMVIQSGAAPKGVTRPQQVMIAVQAGAELGFTPLASLANIPVINGRASIMGDAALALVRQSGKMGLDLSVSYAGEGDAYGCTVSSRRIDETEPRAHTFTIEHAKIAKLWNRQSATGGPSPWVTYPDRMLYYRALGFHLRDVYSDVLMGMAIMEEVRDYPISISAADTEPPDEVDPLLQITDGGDAGDAESE